MKVRVHLKMYNVKGSRNFYRQHFIDGIFIDSTYFIDGSPSNLPTINCDTSHRHKMHCGIYHRQKNTNKRNKIYLLRNNIIVRVNATHQITRIACRRSCIGSRRLALKVGSYFASVF